MPARRPPLGSIVGHVPAVALLRRAVARGRVPQSLLLAGPEGVGKGTVALALAQAVNCPDVRDGDGCGVCANCRRIACGQFSDVTVLDRGGDPSIKIGPLRERVLDAAGYRPFEGRRRVFIIDPADALTEQAQDALLKTLEEPPPAVILMLVTAYPDTLLPTVLSRCRRLRFGPLAEPDVTRVLEARGVDAAEATRLAAASGGSVARALDAQSGAFESDRDVAVALLRAAGGARLSDRLQAAAAMAAHGSKRRDREALADRLDVLGSLVRDLAALAVAGPVPLANADLEQPLASLTRSFDLDRLTRASAALARASGALSRNASPKIVADWLAVSL